MQIRTILDPYRIASFALAGGGAWAFHALGLPLPIFLGPMFACLVAALAGLPLRGAAAISSSVRPVLGVAVGASLTPALFARMGEMALSVALIPVFVLLIGLAGYPYFRRLWGYDHATAYYSAMPGGLQDMAIFGEAAGGDVRALSLIHTTRVLVIVSAVPFLLTHLWDLHLTAPPGAPASTVPPLQYVLMIAAGALGWWGGVKVGLFGAPILGPVIVAGAAAISGLLTHRPPADVMQVAQFFLGLGIGVKYAGITTAEIRRHVASSLGYCAILAVLSVVFAEIAIQAGLAAPREAIMAFAPGGQAEMVLLAIIAGSDMAYVVTHHLVRLIVVILGAPIVARLMRV